MQVYSKKYLKIPFLNKNSRLFSIEVGITFGFCKKRTAVSICIKNLNLNKF